MEKELQQVNVKQKRFRQIQAHSGIIRHIQEFLRHIQACSEPCVTLTYILKLLILVLIASCIFKTQVYPEPWHIQNQKHIQNTDIFTILVYSELRYRGLFRTLAYSNPEAYSEHCEISAIKRFAKIKVNGCVNFRKLFSQYKLVALFTSLNKYYEVVTPAVVILCKKHGTRGDQGT